MVEIWGRWRAWKECRSRPPPLPHTSLYAPLPSGCSEIHPVVNNPVTSSGNSSLSSVSHSSKLIEPKGGVVGTSKLQSVILRGGDSLVGLSPQPGGSDAVSRQMVSGLNFVVGPEPVSENCLVVWEGGSHTHIGIGSQRLAYHYGGSHHPAEKAGLEVRDSWRCPWWGRPFMSCVRGSPHPPPSVDYNTTKGANSFRAPAGPSRT